MNKISFNNILIVSFVILSIIIATIIWPILNLNFSNFTQSTGAITNQGYSTDSDTIRYIVFISLPLFTLLISLIYFEKTNLRKFNELIKFPEDSIKINIKVFFFFIIFLFFLIVEFFSLQLPSHQIDTFHDGELFSVTKNAILRKSFFIDTYTIHGFSDIFYPFLFWKIFNQESIGAGRLFFFFIIFLLKFLTIILSYQLTKFSSVRNKEIFFIILSLILISLSEYRVPMNFSYFSYRDIFIILFLIFFSKIYLLNGSSIVLNILIGVVPSIALLMHIDTGTFLYMLLILHIFFLLINKKINEVLIILLSIFFSWSLLLSILGFNEILNFLQNAITIILSMDYLHGIAYPDPFTSIIDNKNGMRATRGLLLQVTAGLFVVYHFLINSKSYSKNSKIFFIFLFFLSFIMYKNALGRSDSYHIRMSNDLPILINVFFLLNFFLKFFEEKIKLRLNHMTAIYFAILLFSLTYIQKIDYKNLTSVKSNYSELISLPDEHFIDHDKYNFIMDYKILTKTDECFQNFTDDLILLYLLNKPSCSKFVASWLASPKSLQKEYISAIKKTKPSYILYESKYFKVDDISMSKRLTEVNTYIMNNYEIFKETKNFKILKILN